MPNSGRRRGEQWDLCARCGRPYPMSMLGKQKGSLICFQRCWDDLTVERRQEEIERCLTAGAEQEGADLRMVDRAFFEGADEVQF